MKIKAKTWIEHGKLQCASQLCTELCERYYTCKISRVEIEQGESEAEIKQVMGHDSWERRSGAIRRKR